MKINKNKKTIITKLISYDSDKKERPYYRLVAYQQEKKKALKMIEHIKNMFGLNGEDIKDDEKKELKRQKIKWTRDEKGNIISPFSKKVKNEEKRKTNN